MKKLYEGKTKNVMLDEETGIVHLFFKDSATGENGVFDPGSNSVGGSVEGKGKIGLEISKYFFELMEKNGVYAEMFTMQASNYKDEEGENDA